MGGPQVVPTLQAVVEELRETVELTSKMVGNTVAAVGDEVSPIYKRVRQKAVEKPSFKKLSGKAAAATDLVGDGLSTIVEGGKFGASKLLEGGKIGAEKIGDVVQHKVAPAVEEIFQRLVSGTKAIQG